MNSDSTLTRCDDSEASPSASATPVLLVDDLDSANPVYDACTTERTDTPGRGLFAMVGLMPLFVP